MTARVNPARSIAHAGRLKLVLPVLPVLLVLLGFSTPPAGAVTPRASMADIQHQVMCVTCGIPLEEAVSPQADRERAGIQAMIDQGMTTAQIKQALVVALGPGVLALPPRSGFDLAVYIVPVLVILLLLVILAVGLRRWRRRDPIDPETRPPGPDIAPRDATRLREDLVRFDA